MLSNLFRRASRYPLVSSISRLSSKSDSEQSAIAKEVAQFGRSTDENRRGEKGVNMVVLLGRVGRTPELGKNTEHPVITFPMATAQNLKNADGTWTLRTQWHRIAIFRPNVIDYVQRNVRKGDRIHLTGTIIYRQASMPNSKPSDEPIIYQVATIVADEVLNLTWMVGRTPGEEKKPEDASPSHS